MYRLCVWRPGEVLNQFLAPSYVTLLSTTYLLFISLRYQRDRYFQYKVMAIRTEVLIIGTGSLKKLWSDFKNFLLSGATLQGTIFCSYIFISD